MPLDVDMLHADSNFQSFVPGKMQGIPHVHGALRRNIAFWQAIGASQFVLSVIQYGYRLPFSSRLPEKRVFPNHNSAHKHAAFVDSAIKELLTAGCIRPVSDGEVHVVSPLGVVEQHKLRLILDLRYVNSFLSKTSFRYEDIKTAAALFNKGDYFFVFDLRSAYHHIDIAPSYEQYLGFEWRNLTRDGAYERQVYLFCSLPFGLATAPFVFTKVTKALIRYWRSCGLRIFMYLDDGAGAESDQQPAQRMSEKVARDLRAAGFNLSPKRDMVPRQKDNLLGFCVDLANGQFTVTPKRQSKLKDMLSRLQRKGSASARDLAKLAGTIISMSLVLGQAAQLRTRALYRRINAAEAWDSRVDFNEEVAAELQFWRSQFDALNSCPIWPTDPQVAVITYSDASDVGWGGVYSVSAGKEVAKGTFPSHIAGQQTSSTLRELLAVKHVLTSFQSLLRGKCVKHRSDNQNAVSILAIGSPKRDLHEEALAIAELTKQNMIRLIPEWIPREENSDADYLSKTVDADDWRLQSDIFDKFNRLWGPFTIDMFASSHSTQLSRFASRYYCPGATFVDAFTVDWGSELAWLVPPPRMIGRVLRYLEHCRAHGTLVAPLWPSAPWWPCLVNNGWFIQAVIDWRLLPARAGMFSPSRADDTIFCADPPSFHMIACRICHCGSCPRPKYPLVISESFLW